jgi:hypothetical protein
VRVVALEDTAIAPRRNRLQSSSIEGASTLLRFEFKLGLVAAVFEFRQLLDEWLEHLVTNPRNAS